MIVKYNWKLNKVFFAKTDFKYGMQRNLVHFILATVNILRINYNMTVEFSKVTMVIKLKCIWWEKGQCSFADANPIFAWWNATICLHLSIF